MCNSNTEIGVYNPNRMRFIPVRILQQNVLASHDLDAVCHETRHFIDSATLQLFEGGAELFSSIVECIPKCMGMLGLGMNDQTVLGMLPNPLRVTYQVTSSDAAQGKNVELTLKNVVVVNRLPVAIHISVKKMTKDELGLFMNDIFNSREPHHKFNATNLPEQYRDHPFWAVDGSIFIGISNNMAESPGILQSQTAYSKDKVNLVTCFVCKQDSGKLLRCSRCLKISYCGKEHQKEDWHRHKKECTDIAIAVKEVKNYCGI